MKQSFSQPDELGGYVSDACAVAVRLDVRQHGGEHFFSMAAVVADGRDRQLGQLPAVKLANFGGGNLELRADAPEQAAHHLALGLERPRVRQVEDDASDSERQFGGHHTDFSNICGTGTMMAPKNAPPGKEALWGGKRPDESRRCCGA